MTDRKPRTRALRLPRPGIVRVAVSPLPNNKAMCECGQPAPRGIIVWTNGELFRVCYHCFRKGIIKAGRQKRIGNVAELNSSRRVLMKPGIKYKSLVFRFAASWRLIVDPTANKNEKKQCVLQVQTYGVKTKLIEAVGYNRHRLWQAAAIQLKRHYDSAGWPVDKLGGWTKKKQYWSPLLNDGYGGYQEEPDATALDAVLRSKSKRKRRTRYWNPEAGKFQSEPWLEEATITDVEGSNALDLAPAYWWSVPDDGGVEVERITHENEGWAEEESE